MKYTHTRFKLSTHFTSIYSCALHAPLDHRLVRWEGWEENEAGESKREVRSICTMDELKDGAKKELFCFSDMFKADSPYFLFLCSDSPSPLSSLSRALFFSEVSIAAGHNEVDLEFLSLHFGSCMFVWVCLLSWIKGVELLGGLASGGNEALDEAWRAGTTTHHSFYLYVPTAKHTFSRKHICASLLPDMYINHNTPTAEWWGNEEC